MYIPHPEVYILDEWMQAVAIKNNLTTKSILISIYMMEGSHNRELCHLTFLGAIIYFINQPKLLVKFASHKSIA